MDVDQQEDAEAIDYLAQCVAQHDVEMDDGGHKQSGDGGNDECDANNDGGGCVGDEVDDDYLEEMLQAIGPEILLKNPKGLENLERVTKGLCMVLKRVVRHTGQCYILCLSYLS